MRAGQLDVMIAIQRATVTQSPSGEPISAWSTLAERPAMLTVQSGYERLTTDQLVARAQVAFSIRWSNIVNDLSPLDRIIYPLSALADSPSDPMRNTIYDIIFVEPIGRNVGLKIIAAVRQDELH